jgi:hypothetical protein
VTDRNGFRQAAAEVLGKEDVEGVLTGSFYRPAEAKKEPRRNRDEKPTHYKVICISMYTEDLERLDRMVDTLKARGLTKANRSALIRYALSGLDLDSVPKGL